MEAVTVTLGLGHTESVNTLTLFGNCLASGSDDGNVYLWSLDQSSYPTHRAPRLDPCSAVKFHPTDYNILYSAHGQCIYTWDCRFFEEPVTEWKVNEEEINSIDILESESRLAAADDTGTVRILDTSSGTVVRSLKKHDNICSVAKFRPQRNWQLISGGLDCRMIVSDWRGSGLGVIIFELNELFGESQSVTDRESHDSEVSTSEYSETEEADLEMDSFNTDNDPIPSIEQLPDESDLRISSEQTSTNRSLPSSQSGNEHVAQLSDRSTSIRVQPVWSVGLPINPPMVHCIACSTSGDLVAAGLERSTIELFSGTGKRLTHMDSLCGHRRAVSALHFIGNDHLLSGGNDCSLFLWMLGLEMEAQSLLHNAKFNAIDGSDVQHIFIADHSPIIRMLDLTRC